MWSQLWSSYIGSRLSKELHTSCVCSCITSTLDKHHSTCQTVYPRFLHSVVDTGWGRLAQRITFCQEQELDLENEVSPTVAQPPGTLFLPTSTTLLTPVHSENDSRVYFMIVLTTDYCWRSWTCRIAAPYKFHVDWLIDWCSLGHGLRNFTAVLRSTQPCIPSGSLNRVPASAGVKAGMSPLPGGR